MNQILSLIGVGFLAGAIVIPIIVIKLLRSGQNGNDTEGIHDSENGFAAEPENQRPGLVTAWLVLMIIANVLSFFGNLRMAFAGISPALFFLLAVGSLSNVIFAVALFKLKKWGFYGVLGVSFVAAIANLLMLGLAPRVFLGLAGPLLLFAILKRGSENSYWARLE